MRTREDVKRFGVTQANVYGECSRMDRDGGDDGEIDAKVNDVRALFKPTKDLVTIRRRDELLDVGLRGWTGRCGTPCANWKRCCDAWRDD